MNPKDYAPPGTLPYMTLVAMLLTEFRDISSQNELLEKVGRDSLTDVTDHPEIQMMDGAFPLPPGFDQRTYLFRDPVLGFGAVDAAFGINGLANARAQLFFSGFFARSKARKYLREVLAPLFREVLGPPADTDHDLLMFSGTGLVGVARYVPGTPSVSAAVTDKRYTSWRPQEAPQAETPATQDVQDDVLGGFDKVVAMYGRMDKPAQMAVAVMLATMWKAFNAQFDSVEAFLEADSDTQFGYLEKLRAMEKGLSSDAKFHEAIGVSLLKTYLFTCTEGNAKVINHMADQLEPINQLGWPLANL